MKRMLLAGVALCLSVVAFAGSVLILSYIGPTNTTSSPVTISAGGAGVKNCLTNLDATSDADFTLRILDGGTTDYVVIASSGSVLIRSWDEEHAFCGSANTAMYISVSAGNLNINHEGYTR